MVKTILYMAVTANGFVADEAGDTSWVSSKDWENFKVLAKRTGNVVVGRGTYDVMVKDGTFPIPDCLNVVMTSNIPETSPGTNVFFSDQSIEETLEELEKKGFNEVLVAGGGELNGSFMSDGLFDEIYLTVEPVVFGRGVPLFGVGTDFKRSLTLLGVEKISESEVQLHYGILRESA
ncbi:MAG: dihydrofolate reductase family protein [Patescibacteria group bacterium]